MHHGNLNYIFVFGIGSSRWCDRSLYEYMMLGARGRYTCCDMWKRSSKRGLAVRVRIKCARRHSFFGSLWKMMSMAQAARMMVRKRHNQWRDEITRRASVWSGLGKPPPAQCARSLVKTLCGPQFARAVVVWLFPNRVEAKGSWKFNVPIIKENRAKRFTAIQWRDTMSDRFGSFGRQQVFGARPDRFGDTYV